MTALEILTAPESSEAEAVYRQAERNLRHAAKDALLRNEPTQAQYLLGIAHHAGMEFVRNHIGSQPDRWERPGTVLG